MDAGTPFTLRHEKARERRATFRAGILQDIADGSSEISCRNLARRSSFIAVGNDIKRREARTAMLVLDMVSEFRFPDAARVLRGARRPAQAIARVKARARRARVPVIYVNDTAGKWESDPREFVDRCLAPAARGRDVVQLIQPDLDRDYFMFKPKHSGFFGTSLESLLEQLGVGRLLLTGITSHQCVLFTAMDAYVRDYEIVVPADCIGAGSSEETRHALFIAKHSLRARVAQSPRLPLV